MISKKMRNISMVCLSFVLALTLAFGLASFSVKTADAAEAAIYSLGNETAPGNTSGTGYSFVNSNFTIKSLNYTYDGNSYSNALGAGSTTSSSKNYLKITIESGYTGSITIVAGPKSKDAAGNVFIKTSPTNNNSGALVNLTLASGAAFSALTAENLQPGDYYICISSTNSRIAYVGVDVISSSTGGGEVTEPEDPNPNPGEGEEETTLAPLVEGDIKANLEASSTEKLSSNQNVLELNNTVRVFAGNSGNTRLSGGLRLGGNNGCFAFSLNKPALLTMTVATDNIVKLIVDNNNGQEFDVSSAAVGSATVLATFSKSSQSVYLQAGNYRIVNTYTSTTGCNISEFKVKYCPDGYTYIGKVENVDAFAKAEYLGVQFKTAGNGAIRFGFMISAVNAGGEAVALSADLLSDATFTFVNLSNGMSANLVPTTLKVGSDETNLYTNLAITGMDAAKSANVLTANLSIKVNGVAIEVNGSETESITAKAQKALEAGQLNQDQAGVYGA